MDAAIESVVLDGDTNPPPVNPVSSQSLTSTSSGFLASSEKTSSSLSSQNRTNPISQRPSSASLLGVNTHTHGGTSKETVVNVSSAKRSLYRASTGENKFVTRDLAALDFLLGIPLAAESNIVQEGWILQRQQQQEDATRDRHYPLQIDKDASSSAFSTHYPESEKAAAAVSTGTWWSKYVQSIADPLLATGIIDENGAPRGTAPLASNDEELERPQATQISETPMERSAAAHSDSVMFPAYTPGRRLDGDPAVQIKIPVTAMKVTQRTMQKTIARTAAIREWERQTAHGLDDHPPLLDGRLFFSASGGYPTSVFSVIRYEPKREEAEFRRKKLESLGGGGSQFVMPVRDWRGISYRILLPRKKVQEHNTSHFNRFVRSQGGGSTASYESKQASDIIDDADLANNSVDASADGKDKMEGDESSVQSISDDESDEYVPGILDDPKMSLGRHRNLMIGDHITGPIVSSTIQFVKPALLKAELNKQFRDRFDGWEPPKAARKYAGAYVSVQEGKYVLKDPTDDTMNTGPPNANDDGGKGSRNRQGSLSSLGSITEGATKEKPTLRIPPSLTLSKIRSLKQQALSAAVRAGIEIGTVALSCVYFERLCLHCRVDKSNRRLCFAACLLIASKLNEPNVGLVMTLNEPTTKQQAENGSRFQSLIRPNKRSNKIFASLLEFFTEDWSLSLKRLLDAEWGVFAALGFSLHATPSQVAFHFKRLMKTLEWNPSDYLGPVMWEQWQDVLDEEELRKREKTRKEEIKRQRKEERLLNLQLELENEVLRRQNPSSGDRRSSKVTIASRNEHKDRNRQGNEKQARSNTTVAGGLKMFNPFGMRRSRSTGRLESEEGNTSLPSIPRILPVSPSMPILAGIVNTWTIETCPKPPRIESAKDGDNVVAIADESESDNLII